MAARRARQHDAALPHRSRLYDWRRVRPRDVFNRAARDLRRQRVRPRGRGGARRSGDPGPQPASRRRPRAAGIGGGSRGRRGPRAARGRAGMGRSRGGPAEAAWAVRCRRDPVAPPLLGPGVGGYAGSSVRCDSGPGGNPLQPV